MQQVYQEKIPPFNAQLAHVIAILGGEHTREFLKAALAEGASNRSKPLTGPGKMHDVRRSTQ